MASLRGQQRFWTKATRVNMIFNGKKFSKKRLTALQYERKNFGALSLGVIVASHDPVTSSYLRIKEKTANALDITLHRYVAPFNANTKDIMGLVMQAKEHSGIIVQLPLPATIDEQEVIDALPTNKDVDVISHDSVKLFENGKHNVMPPVVSAINEIIDEYNIAIENKKVVIVGKGRLVGAPAFHLMKMRGGIVTVLDRSDDVETSVSDADIVVLGAGSPALIQPDMVKEGVVIFDAGTSESGGSVVGDADPNVAEKASFFTPVPGGIGPVAVVEIFANLLALTRGTHSSIHTP